jgi:hypothetical protein
MRRGLRRTRCASNPVAISFHRTHRPLADDATATALLCRFEGAKVMEMGSIYIL